jgi:Xaa-Pro dipeptidase
MAIVDKSVTLTEASLERIQRELREQRLDAWLLFDFRGLNPIASAVLGLPGLSRRYFVLIPAEGRPIALTHRIEQQPWSGWIGENRVFLAWQELEAELSRLLSGRRAVAMEYSGRDAVPYVDLIPAGVVELVRSAGVEVVSSADLVSAFHARWSPEGEASHRRTAALLQEVAAGAFRRIGESLAAGAEPTEWSLREWIRRALRERGLRVGADCTVAVNANAANPHYGSTAEAHAPILRGDLVLIDLWGKEDERAVYADQTWMGYVGTEVPERLREIWTAVRDARDAAVDLARSRWSAGEPVAGYELDDAARGLIRARGFGEAFLHRTGHSIDRELHGSGPNLDNLETRDGRRLIRGIGFSVEPGIYLAGDVGFRSEIGVFMGADGPEVTTPDPQTEVIRVEF